ncbi:MAG: hypothetical protein ACHQPI_11285 [Thermoanaerobaculia bacterium]
MPPATSEVSGSPFEAFATRHFRALLVAAALLLPPIFFRAAATAPLSRIPCEVATPNCLNGDPLLVTSVLTRASRRWDRGDLSTQDDRVFAPYPDAWAMGEPFLLPALVGHPWARLLHAPAPGYNVPLYLACAAAVLSAGALFSRLSGPGLPALLGAILFAWGPARLNNLGVLSVLWAGLVPLVLAFGLDALDGRRRALPLFTASWLALGLGSLYGLLMGALVAAIVFTAAVLPVRERFRRLPAVTAAAAAAAVPLLLVYEPFFHLEKDFEAHVSRELMEGQSGELLSLFHAGAFNGPVGALLERFGPSFPGGTSALFPTFAVLFALGLLAALRPRASERLAAPPERHFWPWIVLAAASFLFAMGPTIHFAGRPIFPGPWALLSPLPVFRSMRGPFRWDQWWDLALAALFALALGRALSALTGRLRGAAASAVLALVVLDVWPRPVPAADVPSDAPFTTAIRALASDAIVAVHPYVREIATRGTWEQTLHGRRLLDSYQTFAPPVHHWLYARTATAPLAESIALYRELGASAVDIERSRLTSNDRVWLDAVLRVPEQHGVLQSVEAGSRVLLVMPLLTPILVDPLLVGNLAFRGGIATLAATPGRLVFRLRSASWPVTILAGGSSSKATLTWDLVGVGGLRVRLAPVPPSGAEVRAADGHPIGRTVSPDLRGEDGRPPPRRD